MSPQNSAPIYAIIYLTLSGVLAGCATSPIELEQPTSSVSVTQARASLEDGDTSTLTSPEANVLWGGTVLSVSNLTDSTQVEIMGFPLDRQQRPTTGHTPQGRFVASYEGFVEPLDFPIGRVVTLLGSISDPIRGTIGEVEYVYPAINVIDSHLWTEQELAPKPRVSFGIGINLGN